MHGFSSGGELQTGELGVDLYITQEEEGKSVGAVRLVKNLL